MSFMMPNSMNLILISIILMIYMPMNLSMNYNYNEILLKSSKMKNFNYW